MRFALKPLSMLTLPVFLAACVTGAGIDMVASTEALRCNSSTTMKSLPIQISGWAVPHYLLPLWYARWDRSNKLVVVPLYFATTLQPEQIASGAIVMSDPKTGRGYPSSSPQIKSIGAGRGMNFLLYEFAFPIERALLEGFVLTFAAPIYGCNPDRILYERKSGSYTGRIL